MKKAKYDRVKADPARLAHYRQKRREQQQRYRQRYPEKFKRVVVPGVCECGQPVAEGYLRCAACLVRRRGNKTSRRDRIRALVLQHYGGQCVYCGNNEPMFLTMDHIGGDGNEHRREIRERNICFWLYTQFRAAGQWPEGFQVLCWSCNSAKHIHGEIAVREAVQRLRGGSLPEYVI